MKKALAIAINTDNAQKRYTGLRELLSEALERQEAEKSEKIPLTS